MFLAPSHSDPGESLLITTLLGIPLGEPNSKTSIAGAITQIESPQVQPPVIHPIKARMGPPEQDSKIKKKSSASESDRGVYKEECIIKDPRDKISTFFRSRYSNQLP